MKHKFTFKQRWQFGDFILGQSFPPSSDLHRLSSGAEDDYRSGSAEGNNGGEIDDYFGDHRTSVKFQDVGDDDEELDREVSTNNECLKLLMNILEAVYALF